MDTGEVASKETQKKKPCKYDLQTRLLEYTATIIRLVDMLPQTRSGNHVGGQLLRSGSSPLPNHREAQAAESPADFMHKMRICLKELRESEGWLLLVKRVPMVKEPEPLGWLLRETDELIRIFVTSIRTAESNAARV